jgi:IPT/TIG domain
MGASGGFPGPPRSSFFLSVGLAFGLLGACAGPRAQVVEDRYDLAESSSAPVVTDIADLGGGDVPLQGVLTVEPSDGVAVVGETLWIHGRSFGRQPAVSVGGRPAAVLARTRDEGILVRVPPLTPAGNVPVVVSNEGGHGERAINVRRYVGVMSADDGQLAWAEVGPEGPMARGLLPVPGRRLFAMSPDGRAAYVVDRARSLLDVIDVAANGGPKVVYQLDLGKEPVVGLAAAGRAWALAVVRAADVVLLDATSPLRPARSAPRALPAEVRDGRIVAVDLSPDGKTLAVALEEGNRVVALDLASRGPAPVMASLSVVPDVRESVIADVAFSPIGDTLWVATGDTPRSRASGPQPTQVFAARVTGEAPGPLSLDIARAVVLPGVEAPTRLSVGRTMPLGSGSTIRLPPERATVFLAAHARAADDKAGVGASPSPAVVLRIGAEDAAAPMLIEPGRFGASDLTPDGRWLLTSHVGADGAVRLYAARADGRPGGSRSIPMLGPAPARRGSELPSVHVQP